MLMEPMGLWALTPVPGQSAWGRGHRGWSWSACLGAWRGHRIRITATPGNSGDLLRVPWGEAGPKRGFWGVAGLSQDENCRETPDGGLEGRALTAPWPPDLDRCSSKALPHPFQSQELFLCDSNGTQWCQCPQPRLGP